MKYTIAKRIHIDTDYENHFQLGGQSHKISPAKWAVLVRLLEVQPRTLSLYDVYELKNQYRLRGEGNGDEHCESQVYVFIAKLNDQLQALLGITNKIIDSRREGSAMRTGYFIKPEYIGTGSIEHIVIKTMQDNVTHGQIRALEYLAGD